MNKKILLTILGCLLLMTSGLPALSEQTTKSETDTIQSNSNPNLVPFIANSPPNMKPGKGNLEITPQMIQSAYILPNVPVSNWAFGCGATAASMHAGYYDRIAYPHIYAGPINGGVFPLSNEIWGSTVISGEVRYLNPLSATMDGLDGRVGYGHVDDFWVSYLPGNEPDPYITGAWIPHPYGECTGDYMKTNQSAYGNMDGYTLFHFYDDGTRTYAANLVLEGVQDYDGGYGLMQFYQSRSYDVNYMYNQYILGYDGNTLGYTWEEFKDQINNGHPVFISVKNEVIGHFMLAIGYDDNGQVMYLYDTNDRELHAMLWGGTYTLGQYVLTHGGVTIVELSIPPGCNHTTTPRTITVDGTLAEWCRDTERLDTDTRPEVPIPGIQELFFTWDDTNFYLGWYGVNPSYGPDVWLYFYTQEGSGSPTSVGGAHQLPTTLDGEKADHAMLFNSVTPLEYTFYDWSGSWAPDVSYTGVVSFTGDMTEMMIPRSELGMTISGTLSLLAFVEAGGSDESWASFPTLNATGTAFDFAYHWQQTGNGQRPTDYDIVGVYDIFVPITYRQ